MKITTLLENVFPQTDISFNDLTPEQVGVILKLASGEIDVDTADERQFDVMRDLRGIGIVDQEWGLSREGLAAARYAQENGGSADLQAARERGNVHGEIRTTDDDGFERDPDLGFEDEDEFEFVQ